jgi:hypothetical protein
MIVRIAATLRDPRSGIEVKSVFFVADSSTLVEMYVGADGRPHQLVWTKATEE